MLSSLKNLWQRFLSLFKKPSKTKHPLSADDQAALNKVAPSVVVAQIQTITEHPDPAVTRVRVTTCQIGPNQTETILCGGKNIAPQQWVAVATVGTDLGEGLVINERNIRGKISRGMICSREELGLSTVPEEVGGIWILPTTARSFVAGQPLIEYFKY